MIRIPTILIATLALAACATPPASSSAGEPGAGPVAAKARPDCSEATEGRYKLIIGPQPVRQGGTVKVTVWKLGDYPGAEIVVPAACMSGWTVSDPGVDIASDGAGLRIGAKVKPGTVVEVSGQIGGDRPRGQFTVIAADAVSLTGTWKEVGSPDCPLSAPPLRELKFTTEGRFNVTWTPFESYVDYWGDYRFDPATGALAMTTTGGNSIAPDAVLTGKAAIGADGQLILTGVDFGRREGRPPAPCLVFRR